METTSGYRQTNLILTAIKTIILAGLLTGALDIIAALTDYYIATGKKPWAVLKFIASGVFGKKAFSGGGDMIFMGFLFHFIIAFTFTVFFFWLYQKISFLSKNRIITGILYGIFVWTIMNLVVLPLSNTPPLSYTAFKVIKAILILIVMIGLPLSFIAHKCFAGNKIYIKDSLYPEK
jgi:hypothetical protein